MEFTVEAERAINNLIQCGYKAYAVGGAVRDNLLNKRISDVDITTSAKPDEVIKAFSNYKVIPTGLKHGTVTVLINNKPIEITTFRSESEYVDNRRPKNVEFISDIVLDLKRRDFTINAMAYNNIDGLVDPYGGINDLNNKVIRAVGNSEERFLEDALRILRALRFSSTLGFEIEQETSNSILKYAYLLNNISKERIYSELVKLLMGKNVEAVLTKYKEVFFVIIPELKKCDGFLQHSKYHDYDVYTHIVKSVAYSKREKLVRLSLLFHDIAKPDCFSMDENGKGHFFGHQEKSAILSRSILKSFKVDNYTINNVEKLIVLHDSFIVPTRSNIKRFLKDNGIEFLRILTKVRIGDSYAHSKKFGRLRAGKAIEILNVAEEVEKSGECYTLNKLAVNGNDLVKLGYKGLDVKEKLNYLLDKVIDGEYTNDKEFLLDRLANEF